MANLITHQTRVATAHGPAVYIGYEVVDPDPTDPSADLKDVYESTTTDNPDLLRVILSLNKGHSWPFPDSDYYCSLTELAELNPRLTEPQ